jgi:hypothetical protein
LLSTGDLHCQIVGAIIDRMTHLAELSPHRRIMNAEYVALWIRADSDLVKNSQAAASHLTDDAAWMVE